MLQLAEFIYEQPAVGDVEYTFKHALTHDVAYNSLLTDRRKLLHERTGRVIETLYAERLEDHLTELAHHFDRGGNIQKAVDYLSRTGARAAQQVAHSEAICYFTRALELLRRLPDSAARDRQELGLQMALSWSLFVAKGLRAAELEPPLVRAQELCEQLGDNVRLMEVLLELAQFHLNRRDFTPVRELAERVLAIGQHTEAPTMLAGGHSVLGSVLYLIGRFSSALEEFERAVELFGSRPLKDYDAFFALNARAMLTALPLILGYPSTAQRKSDELLGAARRSSDPYTIAYVLISDGANHVVLRDTRMLAERSEEMLLIAMEHGMAFNLIAATFSRAWAMAAAGRTEEGIIEMRRSVSDPMVAELTHPAARRPSGDLWQEWTRARRTRLGSPRAGDYGAHGPTRIRGGA